MPAPIPPQAQSAQTKEEIKFLDGPRSRIADLKFTLQVVREFVRGFQALTFVGPCVTIFGSARFKEDHPFYIQTRELAGQIARLGFTVMTGGGPGLMEAANRGAQDVGGRSVGCNIILPHEQYPNPYLDKWVNIRFFFVRKNLLAKYSYAFIVMPGGFGTMDEFFEALTLIQTGMVKQFPIVVFGSEYHRHLLEHIDLLAEAGTISPIDKQLFLVTNSPEEAVAYIREKAIEPFGLKPASGQPKRPIWWLGEKKW